MLTRLLEAGADLSGPRAILVGGGPVPEEPLEEAIGRGRDRRPDLRPDRDLLAGDDPRPGRRQAQARLGRPAAADHPPADPGRRDPRPGPDRRARPRRRRRLAAHRRPRPHRRGGLPLRRGPDRRPDRQRRRERRPGRGRGGAAAPPRGRRRRGGRPRGPRVAAGGDRGRRPRGRLEATPDDLRRHCAESLAGLQGAEAGRAGGGAAAHALGQADAAARSASLPRHAHRRHLLRQGRRPLASSTARPSPSSATAPRATPTPSTSRTPASTSSSACAPTPPAAPRPKRPASRCSTSPKPPAAATW